MAAKKPEENLEEVKKEYDPWKDMRQVFIPKMSRTEQDTLQVGVNDRTYFIPKEKMVEVPLPLYEVIQGMLERRKILEDFQAREKGLHEVQLGI